MRDDIAMDLSKQPASTQRHAALRKIRAVARCMVLMFCLFAICNPVNAAASRDAITGFWQVKGGDAIVRIARNDHHYRGRLVWLRSEHGQPALGGRRKKTETDGNNPDPGKRDRPLVGTPILTGLTYRIDDGDATWRGGQIYNSDNGKRYRCYVWLADADHLKLHGYIGLAIFGKTTTWRRVADPRRAQARDNDYIGHRDETAAAGARRRAGPS